MQQYRVIARDLLIGDTVYRAGDLITDESTGVTLGLFCGQHFIEPVVDAPRHTPGPARVAGFVELFRKPKSK